KAVPVALRIARIVPIRGNQEDIDVSSARPDRLLLDAADPRHAPVELDHAGGRNLVTVVDVAPSLLEQLERERQSGRRTAHAAEVEADRKRKAHAERLRRQNADQGSLRLRRVACLAYQDRERAPPSPDT